MVDACDVVRSVTPESRWRFHGRKIGGQLLARLLALADPGRPIPARAEASADPAGRDPGGPGRRAAAFSASGAFGAAGYIDVDL
ncbi:MAG TPA: hypothetical protein PLN41_11670 [Methanothrix sp.]|nr:hypothetical protein [Methanothrix sp.]